MDKQFRALLDLGQWLRAADYRFIAPTPATHTRINARPQNRIGKSLMDVFGWSRPFRRDAMPLEVLKFLEEADSIVEEGDLLKSKVRFGSLGDLLLVHSAFPTTEADSVFFGPDTYRFARLLRGLGTWTGRVVDVGSGTGAGGLFLGRNEKAKVMLTDINDKALRFCRLNAELNDQPTVHVAYSDILEQVGGPIELVISNPPYLSDGPAYRDGGVLGIETAWRITEQALARLVPGGRLVLYTGAPIVSGVDRFFESVAPILHRNSFTYEEIDPDLFGDELDKPGYADVERIAAIALSVQKRRHDE
jgi:SAM-dependent methyltransferase